MTFTLAPDELDDAALLHRAGSGDPEAAARLWVRLWPQALTAARGLVDPAEVPGLAAEALVGTLAAIALGTGPADDPAGFVVAAVHELGEDELTTSVATTPYPDVFASRTFGEAFATIPVADQQLLWAAEVDGRDDTGLATTLGTTATEVAAARQVALGGLQAAYLRKHAAAATSPDCVDTHAFLGAAAAASELDPAPQIPSRTWVHLSECAVCTEAFHETAHSPVALGALLGTAIYPGPVPAVAEPVVEPVAGPLSGPLSGPAAVVLADAVIAAPVVAAIDEAELEEPTAEDVAAENAALQDTAFWAAPLDGVAVAADGLEDEPVDEDDEDEAAAVLPAATVAAAGHRRTGSRRQRPVLVALAAAVLIGVVGVSLGVARHGDEPASAAADTTPTASPTADDVPVADPLADPSGSVDAPADPLATEEPSTAPTPSSSPTATAAATAAAAVLPADDPKPSAKPTKKASASAKPSATPKPTPATSSPAAPATSAPATPTPSATPTKHCNVLQVLLGCKP